AEHVHDAAEGRRADRHRDRLAGVRDGAAAAQPLARAHRDAAADALAELLLDLERQVAVVELQRIVDLRDRVARELDVDDGADHLDDRAFSGCRAGLGCRNSAHLETSLYCETAAAPPTIS